MKKSILNTELTKDNPWEIIYLLADEVDKRFTVDEILEVWYSVYGEDMAEPKFIDELRQRIS